MDKGNNKKNKQHKNRNREAVEFVLANRDPDDPNYNNPNINKKILLQVTKNEDLTEKQIKLIDSIPKNQRGIYDEEDKFKKLFHQENNEDNDNKESQKKGVKFNFNKNEIINIDKKQKISNIQKDKLFEELKNNKIDLTKIEDEQKVNEIFKKLKINAKMVEYNELGVKKDTNPELLSFITEKEFVEGVDIFVPAPKDNDGQIIEDYDNDMREENMNEEFKELEKELKSDSENENYNKNKIKDNDKIAKTNNDIEIKGDLEDDFVLLANGGELPFELLTEKEIKEDEKRKDDMHKKNNMNNFIVPGKSYKYITPEEVEYVKKKFLEEEDGENQKSQKKGNFISKKEFNDAINEILNSRGNTDRKKETVKGLKKSILDEEEYEEYELSEEEEEIKEEKNNNSKKLEEKVENKKNIDNKTIKNIFNLKKNEKEELDNEFEEEEEEEEDEEDFKPNIKIEYISKADEPDPFDTEKAKRKKKQKNKKEMKKSKTKQYEQLKAMGELSDESFGKEQLNEMILDENMIEKTKQMIENNKEEEENVKEIEKEIENKYIFEPKIKTDITQVTDKVVNLPKSIKEERREKNLKKNKNNEEEEEKEKNLDKQKDNNGNNNFNTSRRAETKEEKKLRQKLLKIERKEKRAEKKKLKNAFKEEKVAQQKQIAQANKIVRYGLSVKDI